MTLQIFKPGTFQMVDLIFIVTAFVLIFCPFCSRGPGNMDGTGTRLWAERSEFESGKVQESFFFP
jgi:hypothetical protein